ncbi:MAG: restriction endonuclease [Acidimicrobiia bacterium]
MTIWGIHCDQPDLDLVGQGFVSVGWDEIGDLRGYSNDPDGLKAAISTAYPSSKPGAIPVWAGVLNRFAFAMSVGDYVINPNRADSTLNFGQVDGGYYFKADAEVHKHRRPVKWLRVGIPRAQFSQTARYEIGSAVTLFAVKNHAAEFLTFIKSGTVPLDTSPSTDEGVTTTAEAEPNAQRISTYTRDFIIDTLYRNLGPHRFEEFTAALLRAMGYRALATPPSGDGGVDVIAHRDPLGLEPPIIKVQCKKTLNTIGGPDVQKLAGALAHGGAEVALFITLGTYSSDAIRIERTRQDLRLINGAELVSLILEHYELLEPEWKQLLPLRRVYVVDREPEA